MATSESNDVEQDRQQQPSEANMNASVDVDCSSQDCDVTASTLCTNGELDYENEFDVFCNLVSADDDPVANASDCSEPFYFESDHVALKGNEDYRRLLRTFVVLESQRSAAVRDLDTLLELQKKAVADPLHLSQELQKGTLQNKFPKRFRIAEIPNIAWERYTEDVDEVLRSLGGSHHATRQKQRRDLISGIRQSVAAEATTGFPVSSVSRPNYSNSVNASNEAVSCRPATFNQPWSADEQRQLEQLLDKHPPERFESRRFAKIAAELPGRTTQQVASRVQKYFIKLAKAGLPVPGRMPNLAAYGGRNYSGGYQRHHRYRRLHYSSSTFMTSYEPPVYMSDDEGDESVILPSPMDVAMPRWGDAHMSDDSDADVGLVPSSLHSTAEYEELQALIALRNERAGQSSSSEKQEREDLSEPRCSLGSSSSQYSDTLKSEWWTMNGRTLPKAEQSFVQHARSRTHIDLDYVSDTATSYLDPNYMPAT